MATDDFAALMFGLPEQQMDQQALASQLRNQAKDAMILQLSNDKAIAPVGQQMYQSAYGSAQQAGQDRIAEGKIAATNALALSAQQERQANQEENRDLRRQQIASNEAYRQESMNARLARQDEVDQQRMDRETRASNEKIGRAMERLDLVKLAGAFQNVKSTFNAFMRRDNELPGINPWMGKSDTAKSIGRIVSDDQDKVWQAIEQLFNPLLKERSGAAVTVPEYEKLKGEIMGATTEKAFFRGLDDLQRKLEMEQRSVYGANPLGAEMYQSGFGAELDMGQPLGERWYSEDEAAAAEGIVDPEVAARRARIAELKGGSQ